MEITLAVNITVALLSKASYFWPTFLSPSLTSQPLLDFPHCPHEEGSGSSHHQPQGAVGMYWLAVKCADNAIISLLHRPYSHPQKLGSTVRMVSFDLSGTFNTIQSHLLGEKL